MAKALVEQFPDTVFQELNPGEDIWMKGQGKVLRINRVTGVIVVNLNSDKYVYPNEVEAVDTFRKKGYIVEQDNREQNNRLNPDISGDPKPLG